jgi:hypothetical protein
VYVQWRLQRHVKMEGTYLTLRLGPRPAELMPIMLSAGGGLLGPGGEGLTSQSIDR